jgi:hypothetical protein
MQAAPSYQRAASAPSGVVRSQVRSRLRATGKNDGHYRATRYTRVQDAPKGINPLPPRFPLVHIATSRFSVLRGDAGRAAKREEESWDSPLPMNTWDPPLRRDSDM